MVQKQKCNFVGIGFLDGEKLNHLLQEEKRNRKENKTNQTSFIQCTLSKEIYSLGRTIQSLTRLEIDLTDDSDQKHKEAVGKKVLL